MRWHLSRATPVRDAEGRVIQWLGIHTDIHEHRLALEERTRLLERERAARHAAEAANRAKDVFLATVSHELRGPLTAIVGWTDIVQQDDLPLALQRHAIAAIQRNAQQQAKLIDDLLDTSRILSGKLKIHYQKTALADPVRCAVEAILPRAAERRIAVGVRDDSDGACVVGDAARLQQVAANLVSNAVKFSRDGGRVDVRIVRAGARVALEVEDEGEGIAPEALPRIFGRFQQGDASATRRHGGLGLGLSIVRNLVELHGGTVHASSRGRGQGALFRVELPLGDSAATVSAAQAAPGRDEPGVSLRGIAVLLVDDEAEAREVLSTLLLARGASVATAGSVAEALASLRAHVPDVVIADIAMPELDGFELVARLRALPDPALAELPIAALTGFATLSDRDEALAGGFDAYLTKPLEVDALARTLGELVRGRVAKRS